MERAGHPTQWDANLSNETSFIELKPNETVELVSNEPVELATEKPVKPATKESLEPATTEQVKPATEEKVEPAIEEPGEPATAALNSNGLTLPASSHSNGSGATGDQTNPTTNATQTEVIRSIDELKVLIAEMMLGPNSQLLIPNPTSNVWHYEGIPIIFGEHIIKLKKN